MKLKFVAIADAMRRVHELSVLNARKAWRKHDSALKEHQDEEFI